MISSRNLAFRQGSEHLSLAGLGEVEMTKEEKRFQGLPSLRVQAFNSEGVFFDFFEPSYSLSPTKSIPTHECLCVMGDENTPLVGLLGLTSFVCANFHNCRIEKVFEFYRKPFKEDRGFYRSDVRPADHDFFIFYESGVAKVARYGSLLWHTKLFWDDVLIEIGKSTILFQNSFTEEFFEIKSSDGCKKQLGLSRE